MKRLATIAGAVLVAAVLLPAPASAQMNILLKGNLNDMATDSFNCGTGDAICNLYHRVYAETLATEVNSPNAAVNGWPDYRGVPMRYLGDLTGSANYSAIVNTTQCEAWYQIWTGVSNPGLGTFISYYGSHSQIGNLGDTGGNAFFANCNPASSRGEACFGVLDNTLSRPSSPGTPLGTVAAVGALAPVPIPTVTSSDTAGGTVSLAWPAAAAANTINLPSSTNAACPPGAFFNDLTATNAPNPVFGIGLFVHTVPTGGAFRSLASLEGSTATAGVLDALQNPGSQIACTGTVDCPGVRPVPCNAATGGVCVGDGTLFSPAAQAVTLSQAAVNAALGTEGPLDGSKVAVFNTKVFFRCSVPNSCANPARTTVNPSLVSLFSGNSTRVSFGALVSRVVFDREPVVLGNRVTLSWSTIGGPFVEFRVQRSDNGIDFVDLGTVSATGADSYEFTDTFRGRRPMTATYRLIVVEPTGESQLLTSVDLSPGSRAPRR